MLRRLQQADRGELGAGRRLLRLGVHARGLGPAAQGFAVGANEMLTRHRRDLHRRSHPGADQQRHFVGAIGHAAHPLHGFDVVNRRLGVGL